jgi:hypothetical protein
MVALTKLDISNNDIVQLSDRDQARLQLITELCNNKDIELVNNNDESESESTSTEYLSSDGSD